MLTINEIFHSIQGEGTRAGEPCVFVRLTGPAALVKGARADFEKMIESGLR